MRPRNEVLRTCLIALVGYVLLTLIFTYPLGFHLNSLVVGRDGDAEQHLWSFWWMHKALLELHTDPFWTNWLYAPDGASLLFFAYNSIHALVSVPLQMFFDVLTAFNLLALGTFVATGCTTYWLAYDITRSRLAAFVAGMVFAFAPAQMFHFNVGQANLYAVEFLPLYILCMLRWLRGGSWPWVGGAVFALAASSFCDWQFAVYLHIFTAIALLLLLWERLGTWRSRFWNLGWRMLVLELLYLLLVSPVVIPMVRELSSSSAYMVRPYIDSVYHSSDVLAPLVPNPLNPLWRDWAQQLTARIQTTEVLVVPSSMSYVALVLAVVGAIASWRHARLWLISGFVFWVFSLGPQLRIFGHITSIPLPYQLLFQFKVIQVSRVPARYFIISLLCLAILAALGVKSIAARRDKVSDQTQTALRRNALGGGLAALLIVALAFELLPAPSSATPLAPVPSFFTDETLRYAGTLLEVPNPSNVGMYYQTVHNHPVVYGELSRDNPASPQLDYLRHGLIDDDIFEQEIRNWRCTAEFYDVTHLVLYQNDPSLDTTTITRIAEALGPQALERTTPEATLYQISDPQAANEPCLTLQQGWGTARPFGPDQPHYRWINDRASIDILQVNPERVKVSFTAHSFAIPRHLEVWQGDRLLQEIDVGVEPAPHELVLDLTSAHTPLELRSRERGQSPADFGYPETEPVSIGISRLGIERQP